MAYVIDPLAEELLTLREAAKLLPGANGKKASYASIWRWAQRGVRGHRLPTVLVGGTRYTTTGAIQDWVQQTSAGPSDGSRERTPSHRAKAVEIANRQLEEMGA